MPVRQSVDACFAADGHAGGIERAAFEALLADTGEALTRLRRWRDAGTHPFLAFAERRDDLDELIGMADGWRRRYRRLVVLGTGGASLGGRALAAVGPESEGVLFLDNADSDRLDRVLGAPELDETGFLIISKSGATAETLAQALLVLEAALAQDPGAWVVVRRRRLQLPECDATAKAREVVAGKMAAEVGGREQELAVGMAHGARR